MRRREFITLLGGAAAAWPLVARGQHAEEIRRVGINMSFSETDREARSWVQEFVKQLGELGWLQGRTLRLDERWAAGKVERFKRKRKS